MTISDDTQFMIDVHKRLHQIAAHDLSLHQPGKGDAIVPVARQLAQESRILCFDEFQVTDIADGALSYFVISAYSDLNLPTPYSNDPETFVGVSHRVWLRDSNHFKVGIAIPRLRCPEFVLNTLSLHSRPPQDLYKNGIQRISFVPCIDLIQERFIVRDLDSPTDYRKLPRALSKVYYHPMAPENKLEFEKLFEGITKGQPAEDGRTLDVWGRKVRIPRSANRVAIFSFAQLCGQALSAADYIEIVKNFDTIFVEEVPQLTLSERDQVCRPSNIVCIFCRTHY